MCASWEAPLVVSRFTHPSWVATSSIFPLYTFGTCPGQGAVSTSGVGLQTRRTEYKIGLHCMGSGDNGTWFVIAAGHYLTIKVKIVHGPSTTRARYVYGSWHKRSTIRSGEPLLAKLRAYRRVYRRAYQTSCYDLMRAWSRASQQIRD